MCVGRGGAAQHLGNQCTVAVVAVGASLAACCIVLNAVERVVVVTRRAVAREVASVVVCPAIDLVGGVVCAPAIGVVACQVKAEERCPLHYS